ncbi:hypothetical protein [Halocynthiibacter namhaensis]|uniref:hypothetical protein n=1 Tax=Halocynthiibacter namhaensis TaxID=1290553 RepID=UPI00057984DC|nr:hypothetical protein [Halocynthiibacter namhaensis]
MPPYCFLSEAIDWIALGRVPELNYHTESDADASFDARFYWGDMPDNFEPPCEYPWFDRSEFESLEIPVDERYFEAADECAFQNIGQLQDRISEYKTKAAKTIETPEGEVFDVWAKLVHDAEENLERLKPLFDIVERTEANFQRVYEIAWSKLFPLIAEGKIQCEGLDFERWDRLSETDDYRGAGRFDLIPASATSISLDWRANEITNDGRRYVAMRVRTSDLLKYRERLFHVGKSQNVEKFGMFFTSGQSLKSQKGARRGRPKLYDWIRIKEHLAELYSAGLQPDCKENCIFELICFAEKTLDQSPGRTSVQRKLKQELDAIYARN